MCECIRPDVCFNDRTCWGDAEARAENGEELILSADQETPWLHPQSSKHTCAPDQDYGHECVFQRQERVDLVVVCRQPPCRSEDAVFFMKL